MFSKVINTHLYINQKKTKQEIFLSLYMATHVISHTQ
jgi:hypothetical protein